MATQPFTFTLPGNYTIVANVSQSDTSQYGLATASISPVYVLDQTTLTLNTAQSPAGSSTVTVCTLPYPTLACCSRPGVSDLLACRVHARSLCVIREVSSGRKLRMRARCFHFGPSSLCLRAQARLGEDLTV